MFAGGLLLSSTLIFFAVWLQWTEHRGWPDDGFDGADDQDYLERRGRSRSVVNTLIGVCGLLILAATLAGVGVIFIAAWTTVSLLLSLIVLLAGLDAVRTLRYHRDKLRQLRQRTLGD